MEHYFVNSKSDANPHNNHEVHKSDCPNLPVEIEDLGMHETCADAVRHAKVYHYPNSDGCVACVPECHKK